MIWLIIGLVFIVFLLMTICPFILSSQISRQEEQSPCRDCDIFLDPKANYRRCFGCEKVNTP